MSKHIDVVALLLIALAMLVFSKAPELHFAPSARMTQIRVHNALTRTDVCPLSAVLAAFSVNPKTAQ
jgi:hypothetical protein